MANQDSRGAWRWYHGVAFYLSIQAVAFGLAKLVQRGRGSEALLGDEARNAFYNAKRQPVFAPPDWAFPPVWLINNALCIWGLLRVLNLPQATPGRGLFLRLQGLVWLCYATFNALYFGLRSPIGGALNTAVAFVASVASMWVAIARLRDRRVVLSQSTILPWLLLATPTAAAIATWNEDEYFEAGPFVEPSAAWVKASNEAAAPVTER